MLTVVNPNISLSKQSPEKRSEEQSSDETPSAKNKRSPSSSPSPISKKIRLSPKPSSYSDSETEGVLSSSSGVGMLLKNESSMVKSDCKEGKAAEFEPETSPDGENLDLTNQNQSPESDSADKTLVEMTKEQTQKDENGKRIEDRVDKSYEETDKESEINHDVDQKGIEGKEMNTAVHGKESATNDLEASEKDKHQQVEDAGLTVKPNKITSVSVSEEGENSPDKQSETQPKYSSGEAEAGKEGKDSGEPVEDQSVTKTSARRSTKRLKQDKVDINEPTIPTRSTRGKKMTPDEGKEDKTPTRRRKDAQDSQEKNKNEEMSSGDVSPATCEQKPSSEISDNVTETEDQEQEATTTRRRNRAKNTAGTTPGETDGFPSLTLTPEQQNTRKAD